MDFEILILLVFYNVFYYYSAKYYYKHYDFWYSFSCKLTIPKKENKNSMILYFIANLFLASIGLFLDKLITLPQYDWLFTWFCYLFVICTIGMSLFIYELHHFTHLLFAFLLMSSQFAIFLIYTIITIDKVMIFFFICEIILICETFFASITIDNKITRVSYQALIQKIQLILTELILVYLVIKLS